MIIRVTAQGGVELREPNDFKGFKVLVEGPNMSVGQISSALTGIATVDAGGETAWVSQDALRRWKGKAQPAEWVASLDKMVESVKRFGWVNDEQGTVRAHIEIGE